MQIKDIISKVRSYLDLEVECYVNDNILLALSGGLDSMVLADIMLQLGFHYEVAHVNYRLRGEDSVKDEAFIQEFCSSKGLPMHTYVVDDATLASLKQSNLQAKAREIRYAFFAQVMQEHSLTLCCTAHTQNDKLETFFLHLMRGSGAKGLTSLKPRETNIGRPLLDVTRAEIETYARNAGIKWRHDSSNDQDNYDRNFVRQHVLSPLLQRWPSALESLNTSIQLLENEHHLALHTVEEYKQRFVSKEEPLRIGPISDLRKLRGVESFLYYQCKEFGFNINQLKDLLKLSSHSGAIVDSDTHIMLLDREYLVIRAKKTLQNIRIQIPLECLRIVTNAGSLLFSVVDKYVKSTSPNKEYVDADQLKWPLCLRQTSVGDKISPLGMPGQRKLVSDILTDMKLSLFDKQDQLILVDDEGPIWLISRRLDHRVRVQATTKNILSLEWIEQV